jgi:hypothetical protein
LFMANAETPEPTDRKESLHERRQEDHT